jgi:hypothetical protein
MCQEFFRSRMVKIFMRRGWSFSLASDQGGKRTI